MRLALNVSFNPGLLGRLKERKKHIFPLPAAWLSMAYRTQVPEPTLSRGRCGTEGVGWRNRGERVVADMRLILLRPCVSLRSSTEMTSRIRGASLLGSPCILGSVLSTGLRSSANLYDNLRVRCLCYFSLKGTGQLTCSRSTNY